MLPDRPPYHAANEVCTQVRCRPRPGSEGRVRRLPGGNQQTCGMANWARSAQLAHHTPSLPARPRVHLVLDVSTWFCLVHGQFILSRDTWRCYQQTCSHAHRACIAVLGLRCAFTLLSVLHPSKLRLLFFLWRSPSPLEGAPLSPLRSCRSLSCTGGASPPATDAPETSRRSAVMVPPWRRKLSETFPQCSDKGGSRCGSSRRTRVSRSPSRTAAAECARRHRQKRRSVWHIGMRRSPSRSRSCRRRSVSPSRCWSSCSGTEDVSSPVSSRPPGPFPRRSSRGGHGVTRTVVTSAVQETPVGTT